MENAFGQVMAGSKFITNRMECKLSNAKQVIRRPVLCTTSAKPFENIRMSNGCMKELYTQPLHYTDACTGEGKDVMAALAEYFGNEPNKPSRRQSALAHVLFL